MHRKLYVLLVLLTMSAASSAATDDFDSFMGVGWVWILVLSLYAVIAVILLLASFKTAAESAALATKTSEEMLKQATAPQGLSSVDTRIAGRWAPRPDRLELNRADFEPQSLDTRILNSDEVVVHVDDVVAASSSGPRSAVAG